VHPEGGDPGREQALRDRHHQVQNPPGTGVQTISPGSELPTITHTVTIDGYTQPDAARNTIPLATDGTNAALKIELDGPGPGPGSFVGLELKGAGASNSVIRGLVINDFDQGIRLLSGTGYKIQGNFIGTDPSGTVDEGNPSAGVSLFASYSTIGGASPGARNLISGNGLGIQAHGVVGTRIEGNLIGTNAGGTNTPNDLGNSGGGMILGPNGDTPSKNNVIGDSNPSDGATNAANTIAFNGSVGIKMDSGATGVANNGTRILSNSIFSNTTSAGNLGLGINLSGGIQDNFGVTENDPLDSDTGPNRLQNYPVVTLAKTFGAFTNISWTLDSTPSTRKKMSVFIIQFFSSKPMTQGGPGPDSSGFGEGKTFLGQIQVSTNRQGHAESGDSPFGPAQVVPVGAFVTATATNKATGDTSEFSNARLVEELVIGGLGS
jgi:trimeric autotransporter adhesin